MDFRKFQKLLDERERDFLLSGTPREWENHLLSLGVRRHESDIPIHYVLWSNSLRHWIGFPEELTSRIMALGFIP